MSKQEEQQQSTSAKSEQTNEKREDTCQCLHNDGVYQNVLGALYDFRYLHNYTRGGQRCCLVCDKPIICQTSNMSSSCQNEEDERLEICPLCDHPCKVNGQPCGIHSEEACIYT